jgi:hypothetical protein
MNPHESLVHRQDSIWRFILANQKSQITLFISIRKDSCKKDLFKFFSHIGKIIKKAR